MLRTWRKLKPGWRTALGAIERGSAGLFTPADGRVCKAGLAKMLRDGVGGAGHFANGDDETRAEAVARTVLFPEFIHGFSLPGGILNDNAQEYHCRTWQYDALIELGVSQAGIRDWLLLDPLNDNPDKKRVACLASYVAYHYNPDVAPPPYTGPTLRSQSAPAPAWEHGEA